jgi:hypothetical protein
MPGRDYRALGETNAGKARAQRLHLVRDDAESSLCGIPRMTLGHGAADLVCSDCIDWLVKRRAVSGIFPPVPKVP